MEKYHKILGSIGFEAKAELIETAIPFLLPTIETSELTIETFPANIFLRFINLYLEVIGYEIYLTAELDEVEIENIADKNMEYEINGEGRLKNKSYKLRRIDNGNSI